MARPGFGIEIALVALLPSMLEERQADYGLDSLDHSTVFYTCNHCILLVGGTISGWFCSYLENWFYKVWLGDYCFPPMLQHYKGLARF